MIDFSLEVIQWIILHPFYAFIILLIEYMVMFSLYYQTAFKRLAKLMVIPFVIQDALVNVFAVSIIGMEWPPLQDKEWLVTARLKRWKTITPQGKRQWFRHTVAHFICGVLNKYAPGHC